jgi:hypothetical protein
MSNDNSAAEHLIEYVTVMIGASVQPSIARQDVFMPDRMTLPLSVPGCGVLNLRGRRRRSTCATSSVYRRVPRQAVNGDRHQLRQIYGLLIDASAV